MNTSTTTATYGGRLTGLTWVAIALAVIGALNWGLVGLFSFDLVAAIFGTLSWASRVVYILVALAGLYLLAMSFGRLRETRRPRVIPAPSH